MKILTVGVFDFFHYGHLKLLERCKNMGDYLVVAVQIESEIRKNKPNTNIMYTTEQRKEMVMSIKYVDEVVEYGQIDEDITKFEFDIFVVGGDQRHKGFENAIEWCEKNGKKVVRLERTPGICSSDIKETRV